MNESMAPAQRNSVLRFFSFFLLWLIVTLCMMIIYYDVSMPLQPQLITTALGTLLSLPLSWYAAMRLVPKFLYERRIGAFIWRLSLLTIADVLFLYVIVGSLYHEMVGKPLLRPPLILLLILLLSLFVHLIFISIACGVRIIADRYNLEQRLLETEKEKVSAELNFLRSQINPHFLFNVLNTIYFQIDKANTPARDSVEKFSEMLRYQLYDCKTDKIEIKREIEYIQSYVTIQSLRLDAGTDVQFHVSDKLEGFGIAPFMFLTLVENAFKHISHFKDPSANKIHIDIGMEDGALVAKVVNTYEKGDKVQHIHQSGGMGMQNLRRRIELLYPRHARLSVNSTDRIFQAVLNVRYHD